VSTYDEAPTEFTAGGGREAIAPEIIWRPKVDTRHMAPVINHITGFIPREPGRRRNDFLIFLAQPDGRNQR